MPKSPFVGHFSSPAVRHIQPVPWEVIKEVFGVLLVQDEESYTRVSVLCTREPLQRWRSSLTSFPSGNMSVGQSSVLTTVLLTGVYGRYHHTYCLVKTETPRATGIIAAYCRRCT
jgi:hypothetical protein